MKKLNFTLAIAIAALGLTASSIAQVPGPTGGAPRLGGKGKRGGEGHNAWKKMQKANEEIFAKLNLTPDQQSKLKDLSEKTQADMKDAMAKSKGDRDALKPALRDIVKSYQTALATILTPEQMEKFKELRREEMKNRRNKLGGAPKLATP